VLQNPAGGKNDGDHSAIEPDTCAPVNGASPAASSQVHAPGVSP
jgi:hypothetical protein